MVSTRIQTGAIHTKKYTPLSISLHDLSLSSPTTPTRPNYRRKGPGSPTRITKPISPRRSGRKESLRSPILPQVKFKGAAARLTNAELSLLDTSLRHGTGRSRETPPTPTIRRPARLKTSTKKAKTSSNVASSNQGLAIDMCPENAVFPSTIIGAREEVGLSKIGRADKEIQQWEEILVTHQQNVPNLVPIVEEKLQEAKDRRTCLDETLQENHQVGDINPAETAIKTRLETLQWAVETSKFGPETENIKCAIQGYQSGSISYTAHYTLIYGGQIVDTAPTYHSFCLDRTSRLDRYLTHHGPGWLWYEPPLKVHPESKPKTLASAALERQDEWSSMGPYYVHQGFWKRSSFVRRMAQTAAAYPSILEPTFTRDVNDPTLVDCQNDGPRLSFRSLLDSGATFPSLHTEDLIALDINSDEYGAQCVTRIQTANGIAITRLWELFVCVLDEEGKQLVDPNNAVWPLSHHYLGGLCPVIESANPMQYDEQGIEVPNRLSGMVPFMACYVSSAPTREHLFLGEDRNDVLGSHRMPGQKKWAIGIEAIKPGLAFDRYGNPKVRFDHRDGMIVDEDSKTLDHVSNITFLKGQINEVTVESNPGARQINAALANFGVPGNFGNAGAAGGTGGGSGP